MTHEHGVTYASAESGAFSLDDPVPATYKDAQVKGSQMLLRTALSYEAAYKASTTKKAFVKATALIVQNMVNALSKRVEIGLLYGDSSTGLGDINAVSGSGSSRTYIFSSSEWAAGIWAGAEEMKVDVIKRSNDSAISTSFTISSVDLVNRKLTVVGSNQSTAAQTSNGRHLKFKSAHNNEMAGLDKIINNNSTLFNINAGTYNLWQGNVKSVTTALSISTILDAVALGVERGLDEDVTCLVNPKVWADLAADEAALRQYDTSYKTSEAERGVEKLTYFAQNGRVDIVASIYVKEGEAFIVPPTRCKRIGSSDISFRLPGRTQQEDFFRELSNSAGYELRAYTDQALFCDMPARLVKINGLQ